MSLNFTLLVLFIVGLLGIVWGYKRGFARAVSNFIAAIATMFMLGIFLRIYYTYSKGQTIDLIIAIVLLVVFGAIYGILRILVKSVKAISNLPIIAVVDRLLGMVLGAALIVAIFHLIVKASSMGFLGEYGQHILVDVQSDVWLTWIAKYDLLEMFTIWKNELIGKLGN